MQYLEDAKYKSKKTQLFINHMYKTCKVGKNYLK